MVKNFQPEKFTFSENPAINSSEVELLTRLNREYAQLTKAVIPSVVSIDTIGMQLKKTQDMWGRSQLSQNSTKGQGSGVIVSAEGHIVTNHHVISDQQKFQVTLNDGRSFAAVLIGSDKLLDIAVLKIQSNEKFRPLSFGDSSQVEVGQIVFAVGNPFGIGETVTQGIISAKERSLNDQQRNLLQTDAAINPGNSGGPLVNLSGEVVGINVSIFSTDKKNPGYQGLSFSIPSNDVKASFLQIVQRGRPSHGFLGIYVIDVSSQFRQQTGYGESGGALVREIVDASPASLAGLKPQDVVISFDGKRIVRAMDLISMVINSPADSEVKLEIWREGKAQVIQAKLVSSENKIQSKEKSLEQIPFKVRNLTSQEVSHGFRGVVVSETDNPASAKGLQPNDVIIAIDRVPVENQSHFERLITENQSHEILFHLIRDHQALQYTLPLNR